MRAAPDAVRPGTAWRGWARRRRVLVACILAVVAGAAVWHLRPWAPRGFVEYRMLSPTDIPTSVAVGRGGIVWFTIEFSNAIGFLRNGAIERLTKPTENVEPLGLAVDGQGFAWYTDGPIRAISRVAPDGAVASFPLSTPIAKLSRLAVGPDGSVWFAEGTTFSITRLENGVLTRYEVGSFTAPPFGVAVDGRGTAWATVPNLNKLVRITPAGEVTAFDVPTRRSMPGDVAVDAGGAVWFLELRANKIGRFAGGRFQEFPVPTPSAGLTALAVAPDGAVWFTELRAHKLGRLRDGVVTEFPLPRSDARPFGIAVDAANNVWYTDLSGWLGRLAAERARSR